MHEILLWVAGGTIALILTGILATWLEGLLAEDDE